VVARDDDDDDRREREREREGKNRKLFCNIFCVFSRARKKIFSESFFFSPSSSLSKRTTRDAFEQQQQRHEQKRERERERERETSFSLSRDRKNALLLSALLCVCAGVRKKTILINLKIKQEHKNFLSLLDIICFVGFFALVFLDCFFKGHVFP
jgi:hypothetical protein